MQSTNFEFLRGNWPELADLGGFAEQYAKTDPASARIKCRVLAEQLALRLCRKLHLPMAQDNFLSLLKDLEREHLPKAVLDVFHRVRMLGNRSAHNVRPDTGDAVELVRDTFGLARWWVRTTAPDVALPKEFKEIRLVTLPDIEADARKMAELEAIAARLMAENAELRVRQEGLSQSERDLFTRQAQESADALKFDEATTRKRLIDTMLMAAGWDVQDSDQVWMELDVDGQDTPSGTGRVDYVLYDDNGTALAVIEAKRTAKDPAIGRKQAQMYADALEQSSGVRPLILLSNGFETTLVDDKGGPADLLVRGYPDRQIFGMPSRDSLRYRVLYQRRQMQNPLNIPPRQDIAGRYYQIEALKSVAERFGELRKRKALIVQATGTGKTRVAIALADILMRAGFARRILFLCDRRELRRQAKNAFNQFFPDWNVTQLGRTPDAAAQVVLGTYPAMLKRFQDYDVAWFDLIIADESHRSIYNKYRDLFLYFDAMQVGLTATPRHKVSHNTYAVFGCGNGDPTYYYEYGQAVEDGFLVDFKPITVTTKFLREGIRGDQLSDEARQRLEDEGIDPDSLEVDPEKLDKQAYNKDTNRKILRNLMDNGLRDASDNGPGKSIIFARNHVHAKLLGDLFQEMYPEFGPDYCAVIDNYNPRADSLIDEFKEPGNPVIAVSVDMLDTGIDVPEVLNLVFAKPVKSYVKFWQMVGRGTRLCENLHGSGKDKQCFYIFDHWGNCEFFETDRSEEAPTPSVSLLERLFEARLALAENSLKCFHKPSFDSVLPLVRQMIQGLSDDCLPVKEKYRAKLYALSGTVLQSFEPATVLLLRRELLPLMRTVNIRGEKEAYDFDVLITELQDAVLQDDAQRKETLRGRLENVLSGLRANIDAVKAKFDDLRELREKPFWEQDKDALLPALEEKRQALRGIMRYSASNTPPAPPPLVLDIEDSDVQTAVRGTLRPSAQEMAEYRQRVREVLTPHFASNPVLRKLRRGQPLADGDFDTLAALVLTQNASVRLADLREFYPAATELERELRAMVGMEPEAVQARFADFSARHPGLGLMQSNFLKLLQKHIQDYGPVRVETLYTAPFTHLHPQGPDGVFADPAQLKDFLDTVRSFASTKNSDTTRSLS